MSVIGKSFKAFLTAALLSAIAAATQSEERHSVMTGLENTTLSGYVDTSVNWWMGSQRNRPAVVNDFLANATQIVGWRAFITGDLAFSTLETGELTHPYNIGGTLWYRWIAPDNGVLQITGFPCVGLFAPKPTGGLQLLAFNNAVGGYITPPTPPFRFAVKRSREYFIQVSPQETAVDWLPVFIDQPPLPRPFQVKLELIHPPTAHESLQMRIQQRPRH